MADIVPVAAAALAVALSWYRSAHTSPFLVDAAWLVGAAHRLTLGQLPYRDFLLIQTPGTPALLALAFRLVGRSWSTVRALAAVNAGATVGLTGLVARRLGLAPVLVLACCAVELVWAPAVMLPLPWYDADAGLLALGAGYLLLGTA